MSEVSLIDRFLNACAPLVASTPEQYYDAEQARGESSSVQRLLRRIQRAQRPQSLLFSGHLGGGKSSELLALCKELDPIPAPENALRFFPVYLDANEYLDEFDVTTIDIQLAILAEAAHVLRETLRIDVKEGYFSKRMSELLETLLADATVPELEIPLLGIKLKIKSLKEDESARKKVRRQLEPQLKTLQEEIKATLLKIEDLVKERGYRGLVLIVDSLDRIRRVGDAALGLESSAQLFIDGAPELCDLGVHVIYTVHLELVRSRMRDLVELYGADPEVLPMIKVHPRNSPTERYEPGYVCMRAITERRFQSIRLREDPRELSALFDTDALDWLIRYSGGHVRSLMRNLQEACLAADTLPISLDIAKRALGPTVKVMSPSVPGGQWERLARLELDPDQNLRSASIGATEEEIADMLGQIRVLEYVNGGDRDGFNEEAPWYAVHPILRELNPFKTALRLVGLPPTP